MMYDGVGCKEYCFHELPHHIEIPLLHKEKEATKKEEIIHSGEIPKHAQEKIHSK